MNGRPLLDYLQSLPDSELEKIVARIRTCRRCKNKFFAARDDARYCSSLCRLQGHRHMIRQMTPHQRGARVRKRSREVIALAETYFTKFAPLYGLLTKDVQRAMRLAVRTGVDQPLLIKLRQDQERHVAEYAANLAAEHAQPFTPELERHYTTRIKNRKLIEGDCERPWQNYFDYREAHLKDVEPLTGDDLRYVAQWTSCSIVGSSLVLDD